MNLPLKQYWHLLARYLQPQRQRVFWLAFTLLGSIGLQILNPQILRYFIDTAVGGGPQQALLQAALLFIGVALLTQSLTVGATYFGETVAWSATNALRLDLAKHCLGLDLSFHKSRTPGELIERIDGDVNALSKFFSQFILRVLGNGLLLFGILGVLFVEDWRAGFALTIFALTALGILVGLRSLAIPAWAAWRQVSGEFYGFLGEHLVGREDLRANGAISYVMRRFDGILQRWLPIFHKARLAGTVLWGTTVGLFTLGNAIALAIGAYLWRQEAITIGTVFLIFYYTDLLAQPIEQIRTQLEELQQAEASIYRIRELFHLQTKLRPGGNIPLPPFALGVEFQQVWFSYDPTATPQANSPNSIHVVPAGAKIPNLFMSPPQRRKSQIDPVWILGDISFSLPAGQVLGLLGRTGSGKTTLVRLLLRLYDPQRGTIRLSGVAPEQTSLQELRQRVGLVTQDVQLFQTTIRNNLTFFDPTVRDQQLLQALDVLGLSDWLRSLPQGLDAVLGPDGGGLSAGQAQLLALGRIFLKDPGLVILDEASSRLDPFTEVLIERAIAKLLQNRTGIIIAHRLATVQRADQILILEKGRILEYGPREALVRDPNSRFAHLLRVGFREVLSQ